MARYIEKLHGFDKGVTNSMINSWKAGRVKVDGVSYQVLVDLIAQITKIPNMGFNFYREKKLSATTIKDFIKGNEEMKHLVKAETYYEMDSIKKFWQSILKAIIEYISLDTHFDRERTHHFVLLNHF